MPTEIIARARAAFVAQFRREPDAVAFAPGRVNLIGEHIDYNGGTVLPMPLRLGTAVALSFADDGESRVVSEIHETPRRVRDIFHLENADFAAYPLAAYRVWRSETCGQGTEIGGIHAAIASDLPIGAGLSSSAALLVATLRALAAIEPRGVLPSEIAELAFRAETEHIGVACGRMDPYACAVAKPGHALWFDCRDRTHCDVALPLDEMSVLVVDSGTRRGLLDSKYNERVAECREALTAIRTVAPRVRDLCDASTDDLVEVASRLRPQVLARAQHVIGENARVHAFRASLERRDLARAGSLLNESHADLRDRYQVSSPALDALQVALVAAPDCFGARLTGAGFGGCLVALVRRGREERVCESALARYALVSGSRARAYPVA